MLWRHPLFNRRFANALDPDAWDYNNHDRPIAARVKATRCEESIEAAKRALEALLEPSSAMLAEMPPEARDAWENIIQAAIND